MSKNEPVSLGVAVLPSARVREGMIALANAVHKRHPLTYLLDGQRFHPHLTLFQTRVTDRDAAVDAVRKVAELFNRAADDSGARPSVVMKIVKHFRGGFLFFHSEVTQDLFALHCRIGERLHPFVARESQPITAGPGLSLPKRQVFYAQEYGYSLSFEEWRPHITIGRVAQHTMTQEEEATLRKEVDDEIWSLASKSFEPQEVTIYDVGIDGAAVNLREGFPITAPSRA